MISVEIERAEFHIIIQNFKGLSFGSIYGERGSGFNFCSLEARGDEISVDPTRLIGSDLTVRMHLSTILFHGQIRSVERTDEDSGVRYNISAAGDIAVFSDDELLRAFCDTRLAQWSVPNERPAESWHPDKFTSGNNPSGFYLHCNNNTDYVSGDFTLSQYQFYPGEVAERIRIELSACLGRGVMFEGTVDSLDTSNGYVYYTNDTWESAVAVGMILYNLTEGRQVEITAIDTGLNRITVSNAAELNSWNPGDEIGVAGPPFQGNIDSITDDVITYTGDIGEGNLSDGRELWNMTKKDVATIGSHNTTADTITVTNEAHIESWEEGDLICMSGQLMWATVASVSNDGDGSGTITWSAVNGYRFVDADTGWVIYNANLDQYATVDVWNTGSSEIGVDTWTDISGWSAGNVLRIFTPFRVSVYADDTMIWPASDWREGAIRRNRHEIDILTTGSPTKFKVRLENYISGEADESTFVLATSPRVYSVEDKIITPQLLCEEIVSVLSGSGHGLSSSVSDIDPLQIFSGSVSSISNQVITYTGGLFEDYLNAGDVLYNATQDEAVVLSAIDTASNQVTVRDGYDISGWSGSDDLYTYQTLEPAFFEFSTIWQVLEWMTQFGDGMGGRIAWGIRPDLSKTVFMEKQSVDSTPQYIIKTKSSSPITTSWSLDESLQQIRASYRDILGQLQVTDWQSDSDQYWGDSRYRRATVDISVASTEADATDLLTRALAESKYPQSAGQYTVKEGELFTASGAEVVFGSLIAKGQLIAIESQDQMVVSRLSSGDARNTLTTFQLVGVEVNWDSKTMTLIPASPVSDFARMIAQIEYSRAR